MENHLVDFLMPFVNLKSHFVGEKCLEKLVCCYYNSTTNLSHSTVDLQLHQFKGGRIKFVTWPLLMCCLNCLLISLLWQVRNEVNIKQFKLFGFSSTYKAEAAACNKTAKYGCREMCSGLPFLQVIIFITKEHCNLF